MRVLQVNASSGAASARDVGNGDRFLKRDGWQRHIDRGGGIDVNAAAGDVG